MLIWLYTFGDSRQFGDASPKTKAVELVKAPPSPDSRLAFEEPPQNDAKLGTYAKLGNDGRNGV